DAGRRPFAGPPRRHAGVQRVHAHGGRIARPRRRVVGRPCAATAVAAVRTGWPAPAPGRGHRRDDRRSLPSARMTDVLLAAKVLTVSDGVVHGTRDDVSGAALADRLAQAGYAVTERRVVADGVE